jgi:tetratricopeptide (TPR) repeat protein
MNAANSISTAPYPGLRPFKQEEAELFFGRETQTNEMLTRLEDHAEFRFLAVIGSSGSGKSSLVRAGLLPALSKGCLLGAPAKWKFVTARPGAAPLRSLATAWVDTFHPRADESDVAESERNRFTLAQLQAGPLGLVRAYRGEKETQGHAVLILIDQFEELFRFRRERGYARSTQPVSSRTQSGQAEPLDETGHTETSPKMDNAPTLEQQRNEAAAFVELLLTTAQRMDVPMYVVITMRSDFLGDCDAFLGLPEAISRSQYLTPRMTRSQLADAIARPLELPKFNASIESTLITRILNDVGTDPDQLPLMQHALLRTWRAAVDRPHTEGTSTVQLSSKDYIKSGGVKHALSQDAEEALEELRKMERGEALVRMAEMLFRSLAHQSETGQLVRRPVQVIEVLGVVSDKPTPQDCEDLNLVLTTFEGSGRHFLMRTTLDRQSAVEQPHMPVELNIPNFHLTDFIDISHESLLRQWGRVQSWLAREADAARQYRRLLDAVQAGERQLTGDGLDRALEWRRTRRTPTWAMRYDNAHAPEESQLPKCLELIDKSKKLRDSEKDEAEFVRKSRIARIVIALFILTFFNLFLIKDPLRDYLLIKSDDFKLPDDAIKALSEIGIVALPPKIFGKLETKKEVTKVHELQALFFKDQKIRKHFDEALKKTEAPPPLDHVIEAFSNKVKPSALKDFEKLNIEIYSGHIFSKVLEKNDDAERVLIVIPETVSVASQKELQPVLIQAAFQVWPQKMLGLASLEPREDRLQPIGRIFLLIVHLLAYFGLVFGLQTVYRRFAFRDAEFLELLQVHLRRSTVVFSVVLLLFGLVLFGVGLVCYARGVRAMVPMLILGVPVGMILIFLAPTETLLKRSWVPRFKEAQGILLLLCGFYALAGSVSLLFMGDQKGWMPELLLVRNLWALVIVGIGLVILGKRKYVEASAQTVVPEPDQPAVLVNSQTKLYSDGAIGLAAFSLFGFGLPAGVMMFSNLWRMGRRLAAGIGLVAPVVGIVGTLGVAILITDLYQGELELEIFALVVMVFLGSPFATYWLWRRLSGREIRHHVVSGGDLEPRWKALLVLLIASFLAWSLPFYIYRESHFAAERRYEVFQRGYQASEFISRGQALARQGDIEGAITAFKEAQKLDPNINLDPRRRYGIPRPLTNTIEKHPGAVAQSLYGEHLARQGDVQRAIAAFKEAQKLDPNIDLDPMTNSIDQDPKAVAEMLAARGKVDAGQELARQGNMEGAITAFKEAQKFEPDIDLDPMTNSIDQDPKAVAEKFAARGRAEIKIDLGHRLTQKGETKEALQAYVDAESLDPSLTDALFWNSVGWNFGLNNQAAQALIASEKAVKLAAGRDPYTLVQIRDTRGLARALTGDTKGAIEDFEAYISSDRAPQRMKDKRQQWVDALRKGQQPFTQQLLRELRSE